MQNFVPYKHLFYIYRVYTMIISKHKHINAFDTLRIAKNNTYIYIYRLWHKMCAYSMYIDACACAYAFVYEYACDYWHIAFIFRLNRFVSVVVSFSSSLYLLDRDRCRNVHIFSCWNVKRLLKCAIKNSLNRFIVCLRAILLICILSIYLSIYIYIYIYIYICHHFGCLAIAFAIAVAFAYCTNTKIYAFFGWNGRNTAIDLLTEQQLEYITGA